MTVEEARWWYLSVASLLDRSVCPHMRRETWPCRWCQRDYLLLDAASLTYDLAVAEAHPAEPPLSMVAY